MTKPVTVKVDQDARLDLSNRYEAFGWPATVIFDGAGHEIVRRQGYLRPDEMASNHRRTSYAKGNYALIPRQRAPNVPKTREETAAESGTYLTAENRCQCSLRAARFHT